MELAWNFCGCRYENNHFLGVCASTFVLEMEFVNVLSVIISCWLQWEMKLLRALKVWDFCCSAMLLKLSTQFKISVKVIKFLTSIFFEFTFECKEVCCSLLQHIFLVQSTLTILFYSISYFRKKKKKIIPLLTKLKCP